MYARAASVYRKVYLESASPARILDELYARLLADIAAARAGVVAGNAAAKGTALSHANSIISELVAALDRSVAPELCENLARLYAFVQERLTECNSTMDPRPLASAERIITTIREGFQGAMVRP